MKRRGFITAAIPSGDQSLFKMALDIYDKVKPLRKRRGTDD
jgi:hypothetical protein